MGEHFNKIGVLGTHENHDITDTLDKLLKFLQLRNIEVVVEQETAESLSKNCKQVASIEEIGKICDLAIVVGGDGNMLKAGRVFSDYDLAVIGINRGKLGFLTDIMPEAMQEQLSAILNGDFIEEKRFLISASVQRDGKVIGANRALNEVVLFNGDASSMIEFETYIDGLFVYSQRSDGMIIATPTGSTAYALSAGGPIMHPALNALVLAPMFPHTLTSRPIVVDANSRILITITKLPDSRARLGYDSQDHITLIAGDSVIIEKQQEYLRLIHPENHCYFNSLRSKLHWGRRLTEDVKAC